MQQILWAEILVKAIAGALLFLAPLTTLALLGLERPSTGFWPRLVGAMTLGIAAGVWIGLQFPSARGAIGPGGLIAINFATAAALITPLIMGTAAPSRRGKLVAVAVAISLLALAFLEIAHV